MHPMSACRQSNIGPPVHEDPATGAGSGAARLQGQLIQFPVAQILLTYLYEVDTAMYHAADTPAESLSAKLLSICNVVEGRAFTWKDASL